MTPARFTANLWLAGLLVACTATVSYRPTRGSGTVPMRSTLLRGDLEPMGFGAYTYVLFQRDPASDPRTKRFFECWAARPDIEMVPPSEWARVNLTLIPTKKPPKYGRADARYYVENYDLERAGKLLLRLDLPEGGPYLATFDKPLSDGTKAQQGSIVDLSNASIESMPGWVHHFLAVSQHADAWIANGARELTLRLHDRLAQAGETGVETMSALQSGILLLKAVGAAR